MGEQSSGIFAWIGDEDAPFSDSVDVKDCNRGNCSAVLVSSEQTPARVLKIIRNCCGTEVPWLVYGSVKNAEQWFQAGFAGFIPAGTPGKTIRAVLHGISRLLKSAITRNPLSGFPGNPAIASELESEVINGSSIAAYFDISGFKPFNDYYGFSRGDAVLRALAAILRDILSGYFIGHVGGDDFVAIGEGSEFVDSVKRAARIFNGRAGGFYSASDHAAGGIEALDRSGEFRFYPVMDLTVSIVDGTECDTVEQVACKAGLEKKRLKGELLPDTVASFLSGGDGVPEYQDFVEWRRKVKPDTLQIKALLESAGILGDKKMIDCLIMILNREKDHKVRKSAARALGNVAGPDSADVIIEAMNDSNVHVRTAATTALPFVLGKEAGPLLKKAVEDRNTWVRRAALRGLGISGWEGAAEILTGKLTKSGKAQYWLNYRQELAAALEGVAFLGDPELAGAVVFVLRNNPGVGKDVLWKTLFSLGGPWCLEELQRAISDGEYLVFLPQLHRFDPHGLSSEAIDALELALSNLNLRRSSDRIQVLKFMGKLPGKGSAEISKWYLDSLDRTDDPDEFEALLETLKAREIASRGYDLARIINRIATKRLKLTRKGIVSMLRWASTGEYALSKTYLEKLLRHDSREIRNAAARTVISLARKQAARKKKQSVFPVK